jgi:nucleoid DNA-binding protein
MIIPSDITKILAATEGITKEAASLVVDTIFDFIKDKLVEKKQINIRDFGILEIQQYNPRRFYNKHTREMFLWIPRPNVRFKMSKTWCSKINERDKEKEQINEDD